MSQAEKIILKSETGDMEEFEHMMTFEFANNVYIALTPYGKQTDTVVLMYLKKLGEDNFVLEAIADPDEEEAAFAEMLAIMDEDGDLIE